MFSFLGASRINISCLNGKKYVQNGENVSLNCWFSSFDVTATAWFKQIPGEKPLLIASTYHLSAALYHNGFDKTGRFTAVTEQNTFTLNISNTEASDSATYFCAAAYYTHMALSDYTVLVLRGKRSQCVTWSARSGESDPGIIFTHGNRSDQCKKSSETVSPTQSCIYKLPKNNLSLSDAGTYYCAVAACGHIFFGDGTKLDLTGGKIKYFRFIFLNNKCINKVTSSTTQVQIFNCHWPNMQLFNINLYCKHQIFLDIYFIFSSFSIQPPPIMLTNIHLNIKLFRYVI
uniref:Ig-like domain-containing protein n=1 Tax=Astyanax mexicanus TaxID=7994 RepID=A0A3B1IWX7_ASTMX